MQKRFVALALGAGLVAAVPLTVSAKPASFDGTWTVRLVTHSGSCEDSYSQTVAVENGQVRAASAGPTAISGGVGRNGEVALTIRRSIAQGDVSGRLNARSGSGSWSVAMLGCTGRWTASRA